MPGADYKETFHYLAFHTPFGGMVKGAHRTMMRKLAKAKNAEIEQDFQTRVEPGLRYCQRVGNIMGQPLYWLWQARLTKGHSTLLSGSAVFRTAPGAVQNFTAAL